MLYFPQLLTGATGQYPMVRKEYHRTIVDTMPDGTTIRSSDIGADWVGWSLSFDHLTWQEWTAIEALYTAAQGQVNPFTFLDPTDNLLAWSGDLTNTVWTKDPLLTVAAGMSDPTGGTGAFQLTNGGQAGQGIGQTIPAPSGLVYCFSAYVSAAAPMAGTLTATDGTNTASAAFTAGKAWTRVSLRSQLASNNSSITFGLELPPGAQVNVYGIQAEAQPAPSLYKATTVRGGVYPESRFAQDTLALVTTGVNQNSAVIQIFSTIPD